jgi:hypothetical protein
VTWARRKDGTHKAIQTALERLGWQVLDVSRAPLTVDLVIAKSGRVVLVECKAEKGKLTEGQNDLFSRWSGETAVLRGIDDVLSLNRSGQAPAPPPGR